MPETKEYRKFRSETARIPKDAWKKRFAESLFKTSIQNIRWIWNAIILQWHRLKRMDSGRCPENDSWPVHQMLEGSSCSSSLQIEVSERGQQSSTNCDAGCEFFESLGLMIQNCPRTNGPRHERHNNIVKILERDLKERGLQKKEEKIRHARNPIMDVEECSRKHKQTRPIYLLAWATKGRGDVRELLRFLKKPGLSEMVYNEDRDANPPEHLQDLERPQMR